MMRKVRIFVFCVSIVVNFTAVGLMAATIYQVHKLLLTLNREEKSARPKQKMLNYPVVAMHMSLVTVQSILACFLFASWYKDKYFREQTYLYRASAWYEVVTEFISIVVCCILVNVVDENSRVEVVTQADDKLRVIIKPEASSSSSEFDENTETSEIDEMLDEEDADLLTATTARFSKDLMMATAADQIRTSGATWVQAGQITQQFITELWE